MQPLEVESLALFSAQVIVALYGVVTVKEQLKSG